MKILDLSVMRGPNYWSATRHQLIVMKLDIEELEDLPTNKLEGFSERLEKSFPSMYEHQCSEGCKGGFFNRVKEGTWMGHVIEHIALELQTLAGMDCAFGRTRTTGKTGIYNVVFSYVEEKAGIYAAKAAVRVAEALISGEKYDHQEDIDELRYIYRQESLGPSTQAIVDEAVKRGIPYRRMNKSSLVMLGQGANQKRIRATISSTTSSLACDIACDKEETNQMLKDAGIPIPGGVTINHEDDLDYAIDEVGYPLVIKPLNGNHGRGVTIDINSYEEALKGLDKAQEISNDVIVERYITGFDHRILVVDYKFVAAAKRTPACVKGDGTSTIQTLIDLANSDPRRGKGHENSLTKITVDKTTMNILAKKNLTLDSVLSAGESLFLKDTANLSTGGTSTDVTDLVHPYNIFLAERIAKVIGLDICGIDVMAPDLSTPLNKNGGAVLEVNAAPGFRMHTHPTNGIARNVAEPVIDMLFPEGAPSAIPVVAITGTNGKTTTTRLIAHIAKKAGHTVGSTTTDGIYINSKKVKEGDCSGPASADFIFKDPTVDFAVLECARGGILRSGLGFEKCDVGIVTNIAEDHLGIKDINTIHDLARVKMVVPESVREEGYAILNADDDLVYQMAKELDCNIAFFSLNPESPRLKEHCAKGGLAATVENNYITICKGSWKINVERLENIPLTFNGKAAFMIQNILPAVLCSYVRNFNIKTIQIALKTFMASPTQTPGRMNIFQFRNFEVMVDYAHNAAGLEAVGAFIKAHARGHKVGIIAGIGDRKDNDIVKIGKLSAQIFDEIIIRTDDDLRGKEEDYIHNLLQQGISEVKPEKRVKIIPAGAEALNYAIRNAKRDTFITLFTDNVEHSIELVKKFKQAENKFEAFQENTFLEMEDENQLKLSLS